MYGFIGLGALSLFFFVIAGGMVTLLPFITLVLVIRSDFRYPSDKLVWIIAILFLNLIGAALYFFIGRNQRKL
jgi:hypothetical protein